MKKLFSKIAALGAMMLGAFTIHGAANKAPVAANAADQWSVTFEVDFTSVMGWNPAPTEYRLHTDASIDNLTWGTNSENLTGTSSVRSRTLTLDSTDTISMFVVYFKQSGTVKQSADIAISLNSSNNGDVYSVVCNPDASSWSGNQFNKGITFEKKNNVVKGQQKWNIVGDHQGWNPVGDFVNWNASRSRYEVSDVRLSKTNYFRFIKNSTADWGGQNIGWSLIQNAPNYSKYFTNHPSYSDDNIQVLISGTYSFWFEDNFENFGFSAVTDEVLPDPEKGTEVWGLIGSMAESNWSTDISFTYNGEENRYEVTTYLTEGDQFKLRSDKKWDNEGGYVIGWHDDQAGDKANYFEEGTESNGSKNGNFKVKEGCSGEYLLMLDDTNTASNKTNADFTVKLLVDDPTPDPEKGTEVWGLVGSMAESNWATDILFTYNEEENRYEVTTYLTEGDQFKLRSDKKWDNEGGHVIGWHDDEAGDKANYFEEGTESDGSKNGNFKVKEGCSGEYLLKLDDTKVAANKTNADFTVEFIEGPIVPNRTNIEFGEENKLPADEYVFWNDQWWCGSSVEVSEHYLEDDTAHFTFKTDANSSTCTFGFQVFYKNTSLTEGTRYTIAFDLYSSIDCELEINHSNAVEGKMFPISEGMNHIVYTYLQGSNASLHIACSSDYAKENPVTLEISNVEWNLPSDPVVTPEEEAEAFVQEWLALRNDEGSICDQLNGEATALKEMIAKYDALSPEVKAIVDASLDYEGNTIKNSVEYLRSFLGMDVAPNSDRPASGLLLTAVKDNAGTIAIVMALIAGTFVGYVLLRRKNRLVKTSK